MQGQRLGDGANSPIKNTPPRRKRISQEERLTQSGSGRRSVTTRASFGRQRLISAPANSNHNSQPRPLTMNPSRLTPVIRPVTLTETILPLTPPKVTIADFFLNWLQKSRKSSSDERIFILAVRNYGLTKAVLLAEGFGWKCKRPVCAALAYYASMKPTPKTADEYTNFQNGLRKVLQVSKEELNRRIAIDNASRAGKPKRGPKPHSSASGRASDDTD